MSPELPLTTDPPDTCQEPAESQGKLSSDGATRMDPRESLSPRPATLTQSVMEGEGLGGRLRRELAAPDHSHDCDGTNLKCKPPFYCPNTERRREEIRFHLVSFCFRTKAETRKSHRAYLLFVYLFAFLNPVCPLCFSS